MTDDNVKAAQLFKLLLVVYDPFLDSTVATSTRQENNNRNSSFQ